MQPFPHEIDLPNVEAISAVAVGISKYVCVHTKGDWKVESFSTVREIIYSIYVVLWLQEMDKGFPGVLSGM